MWTTLASALEVRKSGSSAIEKKSRNRSQIATGYGWSTQRRQNTAKSSTHEFVDNPDATTRRRFRGNVGIDDYCEQP
jgi:hypothetical protein